jgi:iron(III) transport system substrate-binding protein
MTRWSLLLIGITAAAGAACGHGGPEVVAYTSVDQVVSEPLFRAFEQQTGVALDAVFDTEETKSTGVLNRLLAEARSPRADVFWSGDPVRPFLLIRRGLVEPYVSPNAAGIPAPFKGADGTWTGFAARARILLVDTRRVPAADRPTSIRDLASPRWKGQTAMANPLFGTMTIHMAALSTVWGDEPLRAFLKDLKANDIRVASSNGEVKRLVVSGAVAFGLTDTDDAAEAIKDGAAVAVVHPDQDGLGTLVLPTAVVLLKGGPHPESGRRLIDALLAPPTERQMAEAAAYMPLRPGLTAGTDVRGLDQVRAMQVDYASVATAMERIQPALREWVGL